MMNMIEHFHSMLGMVVFKNTIEDYVLSLLTFLGLLVACSVSKRFLIFHVGKIAAKTVSDFDDFIVDILANIGWPVFIVVSLHISTASLVLPDMIHLLIKYAMTVVITIRVILLFQKILQYGINKTFLKQTDNPSSQAMVKSVTWVAKWVVWILGSVFILDNLGVNISALMAGIGIGGIAVAMASQAILGDAFSALCIYLDRPFEIGDFIIVDDNLGSVEHIGIKTTRIRSLFGEQLIFSNTDLTKSRIKNYKRMEIRRITFKIGVVYQTPVEKVQKIPEMIRDIINRQERVRLDRAHFQSFGDFSLVYEIVYYVLSADYNIYMDIQQAINLEIMKAFESEGIKFAVQPKFISTKE